MTTFNLNRIVCWFFTICSPHSHQILNPADSFSLSKWLCLWFCKEQQGWTLTFLTLPSLLPSAGLIYFHLCLFCSSCFNKNGSLLSIKANLLIRVLDFYTSSLIILFLIYFIYLIVSTISTTSTCRYLRFSFLRKQANKVSSLTFVFPSLSNTVSLFIFEVKLLKDTLSHNLPFPPYSPVLSAILFLLQLVSSCQINPKDIFHFLRGMTALTILSLLNLILALFLFPHCLLCVGIPAWDPSFT